jgi:hypothetical protein
MRRPALPSRPSPQFPWRGSRFAPVTARSAPLLYQTVFTVLLVYLLMFLPRALISLRASIAQVPPGLENVAASLGCSPLRVLLAVTVRLAAPGAAVGAALSSSPSPTKWLKKRRAVILTISWCKRHPTSMRSPM